MAKTKKKVEEHESVEQLRATAGELSTVNVPKSLRERFGTQITRVQARCNKVADNLQKAIELDATKAEREAKKAERIAAREKKLVEQLKTTQEKLDALKKDKK